MKCLISFAPGPCLAQLNVSGNSLGAGGGIALAAALAESSSLRVLGMKAAGMLALPCYSSDLAATLHPPPTSRDQALNETSVWPLQMPSLCRRAFCH